jgi:hypothetical protein
LFTCVFHFCLARRKKAAVENKIAIQPVLTVEASRIGGVEQLQRFFSQQSRANAQF